MLWVNRKVIFAVFCVAVLIKTGDIFGQSREIRGISSESQLQSLGGSSSLKFIPNLGQLSDQFGKPMPEVLYTLDGYGMKSYFTKGSMHYVFSKLLKSKDSLGNPRNPKDMTSLAKKDTLSLYRVDVKFIGSNPNAEIVASDSTEDYTNYYLTGCPDGITHVPGYRKIVYRDIYPKIDLVIYTTGSSNPINPNNPQNPSSDNNPGSANLEYDFVVHPGGDPRQIEMSYDHATSLNLGEDGSFKLISPFGQVEETKPNGYQIGAQAGSTAPRECGFRLRGNTLSFNIGKYDRKRDLIIDPQRLWGTYFGWNNNNNYTQATGFVVDRSGNADLYGYTNGTANIASSGAFQTTYGGGSYDCFLAKFGSGGNLMWSTYYGGSDDDYSGGIACDTLRGVLITGNTKSASGIASAGAFQTSFNGNQDAFLASFDSNGVRRWGTYYNGNGLTTANLPSSAEGSGVAVDSATNIILIGETYTNGGIATPGAFQTSLVGVGIDLFIAKFNSQGSRLWGTYWCGTDNTPGANDNMAGGLVCADANNNIYISASTTCTLGIATAGAFQTSFGPSLFAKFAPSGSTLDWATYYLDSIFPYTTNKNIYQIAASRSGNLYFVGYDTLTGHATTGAYQTSLIGDTDAIMGKFNTNGKRIWVTYYGNSPSSVLCGITLDSAENIFACGETYSATGIATPGEFQTTLLGPYNPFIIKFDSGGHRKWGTYYERRGFGLGIGLDPNGHPYIGGETYTLTDEYATPGASDGTPWGDGDGFVAKFCDPPQMVIASDAINPMCPNATVTLSTKAGLSGYQWNVNDVPIPGATGQKYSFSTPQAGGNYRYTVDVVGNDMCDAISDTISIAVRAPSQITFPQVNTDCPGSPIKLMAKATGAGKLTYSWTPVATLDHPDSLQPIATPTKTTTYTLAVTDSNGCTTLGQMTVAMNAAPKLSVIGNKSVCSGSSVALTDSATGGLPPLTYTWSPPTGLDRVDSSTVIATPKSTTSYVLEVTDANGCSTRDTVVVTVPAPLKVIAGAPLSVCVGSSIKIGAVASGGKTPYTIAWSPAVGLSNPSIEQPTASPSATTLYTISVTDKNGCTASDSVLVTVADSLVPTVTAGGPLTICTGDTVHLDAGTGYSSYSWSDGEKTPDISVTSTGDYYVHVTSATCSGTSSAVHVTVLPDSVPHPVITASKTTICEGDSVEVKTAGSYSSYKWSTGDTTATIFVSKTAILTLTATNAVGCMGTSAPLSIAVIPTPTVTVTASGATTFCSGDSVTLTATSGFNRYNWSSGDSTQSIIVKNEGTYEVTVTNSSGCTATSAPVPVNVNPIPDLMVVGPAAVCPNSTATYTDSTNSFMVGDLFEWKLTPPGAGTITNSNPLNITVQWGAAGSATLTATEITPSGCTGVAQLFVSISSTLVPVITASGSLAICPGDSVTLNAGAGYASYQWSKDGNQLGGQTSQNITVGQAGSYTVFVTSNGGCSGSSAASGVTVYPIPTKPIIVGMGNELVTSHNNEYRGYQWYLNGSILSDSTGESITPDTSGYYTVTITDTNGCNSTSDPFFYGIIDSVTVTARGSVADPGATVTIPVSINTVKGLAESGATTYSASISMDGAMLKPINPTGVPAGNRWIVSISGAVPGGAGVLQTITALALQDSGYCSDVQIDTFYFPGAAIDVKTESGVVCLSGTCRPVLQTSDTAFTIKRIYPNPSDGSFTIDYHLAADGPLSIDLEDNLGRAVQSLKHEWTKAGDMNETYSAQSIPSGMYRLVLRSGARAIGAIIVVAK